MAIVQQFFTPEVNKFGFQGLSSAGQERSSVPRQELFFIIEDAIIALADPPDGTQVFINCTLPFGFSYAITDITMSIFHDKEDDWVLAGGATVRDSNQEDRTYLTHYEGQSTGEFAFPGGVPNNPDRVLQIWNWDNLPTWIIIPGQDSTGSEISITTSTVDEDPGGVAEGTLNCLVRVIQFDIAQAHHFEVNTPLLVR